MKHEGFTLEFVIFIDDYKTTKIKDLIKKISKFLKPLIMTDKELERKYSNILNPMHVDKVVGRIEQIVLDDERSFTRLCDSEQVENWKKKLSDLKQEWINEQQKDNYKAQSLQNKIVRETIKSLESVKEFNKAKVKEYINRAIDQVWLSFELEELLNKVKQELSEDQKQSIDDSKQTWVDELHGITEKYNHATWLDWASENAFNVSFSTHVAKLTHSSIKGASSIYFDEKDESPACLSTAALNDKPIDISQTDNRFSPIGKLLKLQINGQYLADKLSKLDVSDLSVFAKDEEQAQQWARGFINSFQNRKPSSHSLAKQIYFPDDDEYHLISPLVSSSLDQAIFDRINYMKFSEDAVEIRKQKRENKFHKKTVVAYPKIAVLKVTASNHGNASPLNGARGGKRYLLSSMPPNWKSSIKPPFKQSSMFYGEFDRRAWKLAKSLQEYLLVLQDKKSNKHIRDRVKSVVNEIIDTLFGYVAEIQNLNDQAGWSEQTDKLNEAHQLWLDPYRQDKQFQQARKHSDWHEKVCYDFGRWLNHKLEHDKMKFSKIEAKSWAKILLKRLREFESDLEVA